ncbi:MAG: SRPBCC family protein [Betaproteobacteria bacterium]
MTRVFDASRDLLFKAHTDKNLIPQWWGPARFKTTTDKLDVKPGGLWRFVQRDAAGSTYAFHGVYHELSPERIVGTFEFEGMPGRVSLDSVTFEEMGGKTKLIEKTVFQSVEDRDGMLKEGMEEGVYESMDRLAELLAKLAIGRKAA